MGFSNQQLSKIFRNIAAAYNIKNEGNIFQIRAYENAADSIEHSTANIQDLWHEGKLGEVPGLGTKIQSYLDELFTRGKVEHFESVQKGIPPIVFDLLDIPGIGPKTADKIAKTGIKSLAELEKDLKEGRLKDISPKLSENILTGMQEAGQRTNRMLLPYAAVQADRILAYLKKSSNVIQCHPLGSLRRMVATIGDLDFSASSDNPAAVVEYFTKLAGIARILDKGKNKATVILQSGVQVDLLVGDPKSYGALLQHFTGSKNHNIHLRTLALEKGLSLSEYGVTRRGKLIETESEEEFYKLLKMEVPPPELREDTGEIEAALANKLPDLVNPEDIKGDLHTHSNYPFPNPSHGPGVNTMEELIEKAKSLGYEFIGIADHPPGHGIVSREKMIKAVEKRSQYMANLKKRTKDIRVLNGLEIDILGDGSLSVPDEALETLDYCIAGIHSGHRGSREKITHRLMSALQNPHVDIISHPTNRLLNERESSEADWEEIFKLAAKNHKLLEINGYPNRLDLRDDLVRQALKYGVKFVIDTDAHKLDQLDVMRFGVSVGRRGWVGKESVVNAWEWTRFSKWFKI